METEQKEPKVENPAVPPKKYEHITESDAVAYATELYRELLKESEETLPSELHQAFRKYSPSPEDVFLFIFLDVWKVERQLFETAMEECERLYGQIKIDESNKKVATAFVVNKMVDILNRLEADY